MKKFAKMSLVAAVAVAGMTTANAKDLTEAIKGVDVSGTIVYRYNDKNYDDRLVDTSDATSGTSGTDNNYKIAVNVKVPVNDDVKVATRFIVGSDNGDLYELDTQNGSDGNVNVKLSQVNFIYTGIQNTTVIVGKQGLTTPWTKAIDADGNEQTGTGVLALSTWGPVTAAAAYFNQNNITGVGANNIITGGLMGSFAGVKAELWGIDVDEHSDSVFAGLSYGFNAGGVKVGLDAKYTTADSDTSNNDDLGQWEASVSAKMGMFNAKIAYAESDEDGTYILDSDAKVGQNGWSTDLNGTTDAEYWMFDLGAQVTDKLHVGLNYDEIEDKDGTTADDIEETHVQLTYKMSKNFMGYIRVGEGEDNGEDYNRGRLQVQYSF